MNRSRIRIPPEMAIPSEGDVKLRHVAIDGPIGVGKTSLVEMLSRRFHGTKILEDVDNPFLPDFYKKKKGSAFQNDTKHPPRLKSERTGKIAWRAALMKQGHELRPGQTYYILYLNNDSAIKRGDNLEIAAGQRRLIHVPVR